MSEIEIRAKDFTESELTEVSTLADTCNGQAFQYQEQSENDIIVKDALIQGSGIGHCFIHDRTRDVTIDACMGQFECGPSQGAWDGGEHPYTVDHEEVREWESREEFREFYADAPENDFIL
jgi:hypothetical protein